MKQTKFPRDLHPAVLVALRAEAREIGAEALARDLGVSRPVLVAAIAGLASCASTALVERAALERAERATPPRSASHPAAH